MMTKRASIYACSKCSRITMNKPCNCIEETTQLINDKIEEIPMSDELDDSFTPPSYTKNDMELLLERIEKVEENNEYILTHLCLLAHSINIMISNIEAQNREEDSSLHLVRNMIVGIIKKEF